MGKSITPKYRVSYRDQAGWHTATWKGAATDKRAEDWRKKMNGTFQPGGSNEHLSKAYGYVPHISHVKVETNDSYAVVMASATMPMFEAI